MKKQFRKHYMRRIYRPGAEELLEWLETSGFYSTPANTGELVEHSLNVYKRLRRLYMLEYTDGDIPYPEQDESIAICGLLHDIGEIESRQELTKEDGFCGHGEKSVYIISKFMKLTQEETMAIQWHMGFAENEVKVSREAIENIFKQFPLALLAHTADLQAIYLDDAGGSANE